MLLYLYILIEKINININNKFLRIARINFFTTRDISIFAIKFRKRENMIFAQVIVWLNSCVQPRKVCQQRENGNGVDAAIT